jgi:1-acyl-sn-glycerol-3-phosphate acyltransferase
MIKAKHSRSADLIFRFYIYRMFRRHFNSFNLIGSDPQINDQLPLIVTPNHSTWWDGFFLYFINSHFFQRKYYIMMLEDQLLNFPFFAKLGAFSIMQDNPKKIIETIDYSAKILSENRRSMLVMFPQGEMLPEFQRPIKAFGGIKKIIEKCEMEVNLLTLGVKVSLLKEQLPNVFYSFGKNKIVSIANIPDHNEIALELEENMSSIESSIISKDSGRVIFSGKSSVSRKYEKEVEK